MPLPPAAERESIHTRKIDLQAYRRRDGRYDVDAHLVDTKPFPFQRPNTPEAIPAGGALHDFWIRVVCNESLLIEDIIVATDATPYPMCPEAAAALASVKGLRIGGGFQRAVRERLGGAKGCTHLMELLGPIGTAAFQALSPLRLAQPDRVDATGKPVKIDSCYAYASNRDVVRVRWPAFYDGPAKG